MAVAGGLGLRTENVLFPCEARPRLPFVKSCVWVTCAREDEPAGPRTRAGQSWRAFFFFCSAAAASPPRAVFVYSAGDPTAVALVVRSATRGDESRACLYPLPLFFFCTGDTRRAALGRDPASLYVAATGTT